MRLHLTHFALVAALLLTSACGSDGDGANREDAQLDASADAVDTSDGDDEPFDAQPDDALSMTYVDNSDGSGSNVLSGTADILFYFKGLSTVADIATNTYVPGAVADHLTSYGGALPGGGLMSILAWIQAGTTASYGTAVEPCNYTSKFPQTSVFVPHYFRGETVVEAYWKSVRWPGEGNFVGEPLARPYGPPIVDWTDGSLTIETTMLVSGFSYALESASTVDGPWSPVLENLEVSSYRFETIALDDAWAPYYRLVGGPI